LSKRTFPLIALVLTPAVLFTVVAHACSDLSSIQAIVQAPCDHPASQNEPHGMLSTQPSASDTDVFKLYSIPLQEALFVRFSLPDSLPSFWRSQAPPFSGLGVSPHLSQVVLRV